MPAGAWVVVAFAALALITAFGLRNRLPSPIVTLTLAIAGGGLGWGAMLLQRDPSTGEFIAAVLILGLLAPTHVRILLGPFGPSSPAPGPG